MPLEVTLFDLKAICQYVIVRHLIKVYNKNIRLYEISFILGGRRCSDPPSILTRRDNWDASKVAPSGGEISNEGTGSSYRQTVCTGYKFDPLCFVDYHFSNLKPRHISVVYKTKFNSNVFIFGVKTMQISIHIGVDTFDLQLLCINLKAFCQWTMAVDI